MTLLLIVFTDEVGSSIRDEICSNSKQILYTRCKLFESFLTEMRQEGWKVLKNVGDQLVIRFDKEQKSKCNVIIRCLKALYKGWNKCKGKMRVAVYLPKDYIRIGTGNDVKKYLKQPLKKALKGKTKKSISLTNLWPSSRYLEDDIFGPEMNLSARLIGVPKSGLFIVSENLINKINKYFTNQLKTSLNVNITEKVPIVHLKGISTINIDKPHYIREIRPRHKSWRESLYWDTKAFQHIRVININFGAEKTMNKYVRIVMHEIQKRIIKKPLNYFIDLAFAIEAIWEGYPLKESRKWNESDIPDSFVYKELNRLGFTRPSMLLFTSCLDEQTSFEVRKKLSEKINLEGRDISLKILSRMAYGRICFLKEFFNKEVPPDIYLVIFQAKADCPISPDKPEFFNIVRTCPYIVISWGLLVGDIDGFVAYKKNKKTDSDSDFLKFILDNSKMNNYDDNFISRIAPIIIYKLSLYSKCGYNIGKYYPNIWKSLSFGDYEDWRNSY